MIWSLLTHTIYNGHCYRDVDTQVVGLMLFAIGTQPSSHVKVRMNIRAWLERYIMSRHSLVMTTLEV